jgi:raffinose/stachyose/melibiose transport system substrate-binding protein
MAQTWDGPENDCSAVNPGFPAVCGVDGREEVRNVKSWVRRRLVGISLVMALAVAATTVAASAGTAKHNASGPSGTVSMAMGVTYKPGFDILIPNFNRIYPNITINPTYLVAGAPYTTAVTTEFAAGNGPDLVWNTGGRGGPTSVWPFAGAGYTQPLSGAPWIPRMYTADKIQYMFNKHVYAYDFGLSILATPAYNKDFFAQNHLKLPTTFAQLLQLCTTIAGMGKTPIAWAGGSQAVNTNNTVTLAASTVLGPDQKWYAKRLAHQTTFASTPGWRRALQMIVDMKNAKCFGPSVASDAIPQMQQEFASGQAEMMWTYAGLNAQVQVINPTLKIGLFPPPPDNAKDTWVTLQAAGGIGLNAKSSNVAAAKTFINFLGRAKQATLFARINYLISPYDAQKGNLPGIYGDLRPWFQQKRTIPTITANLPNTQFSTLAGQSIQGLFTGQKSVDDVLADMDKYFDLPNS